MLALYKMKIAIVTPNTDYPYLARAIYSVRYQSVPVDHYVFVDVMRSEIAKRSELERMYQGVKNRYETQLLFEATQPMQLAQRLCYFENAGSLEDINRETQIIEKILLSDVLSIAEKTLNPEIVSVINYRPKS